MKQYFVLLIMLLPILLFSQTWQPLPMHGGGYVVGLIPHPTEANTIYARIDVGGIYKSTDQGENWTSLTDNVPLYSQRNFQVRSFVIDPVNPNNMYFASGNSAYSNESAFWWSSDAGVTWNKATMPTSMNGNHFGRHAGELLVLDPNDPNKIYMTGMPYYSGGWQEIGGLFVTEDKGATWTKLDGTFFNKTWMHDLKFKQGDPTKLLLSASNFKESWMDSYTENEGLWEFDLTTQTATQLRTEPTFEVAFDAVDDNTMVAIWEDGIHISQDAGSTWTTTDPFPSKNYSYRYFVTPHPTESGHWFFGYWENIFKNGIIETRDGGLTFTDVKYNDGTNKTKLTHPPYADTNQRPSFANASSSFVFSAVDPTLVYTGDFYGVWRTNDAALPIANNSTVEFENANWSWTYATKGIYNVVQLRVSQHPTIEGLHFNCIADVGYYKASNFGETMEHKTDIPISSVYEVAFEKNNPLVGYIVGKQFNNKGRIMKTVDGGENWREPSTGEQYAESYFETEGSHVITDIEIAGNVEESLIVGIERGNMPSYIYRSDDHGVSFQPWDEGISGSNLFKVWTSIDHLVANADGQTFYAWETNRLYKRHLNDAAWQLITPPVGGGTWIAQVITHPIDPNIVYLSQYNFGIFKSTDGGQTWTNLPLEGDAAIEFAISPDGQQIVMLDGEKFDNRSQQLYSTFDEGATWEELPMDGILSTVVGLEFLSNTKLVAWTEGTGSFTYKLADETQLSESICEGNDYVFNEQNLTMSGVYLDTLKNVDQLDSFLILTLTVLDTSQTQLAASICQGDTYSFNGQSITTSGQYKHTLQNSNQCDSLLILTLTVSDCGNNCVDDLILDQSPITQGVYKAANSIRSAGVLAVGTITYEAGVMVNLKSGFHAPTGSHFVAKIAPCTSLVDEMEGTAANQRSSRKHFSIIATNELKVSPNPFYQTTKIDFKINTPQEVRLAVYSMEGQLIEVLQEGYLDSGQYEEVFNPQGRSGGLYLVVLQTEKEILTKKIISLE